MGSFPLLPTWGPYPCYGLGNYKWWKIVISESETVRPGPCVRLSVKTAMKERVSETVCPRPCVRGRASETVVRDESEKNALRTFQL